MKKTLKKFVLAALTLTMFTGAAFAMEILPEESAAPAMPGQAAPAADEPAQEHEAAAAEPTAQTDAVPAAESAMEPAAEDEATAEPTAAPAQEAGDAAEEQPAAESTVQPAQEAEPEVEESEAEPDAPEAFTGSVEVVLMNEGEIFYGDTVELRAVVREANTAYELRWEVKRSGEWMVISGETGNSYKFVVTEENAAYEYRAVVITEA